MNGAADGADTDPTYILETATVERDSDDEFEYERVAIHEDLSSDEGEEGLEDAVRSLQESALMVAPATALPKPQVKQHPEVMDDFVRNYLVKMGFTNTLEVFETEWYTRNVSNPNAIISEPVPDVYQEARALEEKLQKLQGKVEQYKAMMERMTSTYTTLKKERDFHRMHHNRVMQEKNRLVGDLKHMRKHFTSYEPTLKQLSQKYQKAVTEKMLTKLERDRMAAKLDDLEATIKPKLDEIDSGAVAADAPGESLKPRARSKDTQGSSKKPLLKTAPHPDDSKMPVQDRVNPYSMKGVKPCDPSSLRLTNTINAHLVAVSNIAMHPTKPLLASVSDDNTWKVWTVPNGELIMTGEGHRDWIADCAFHPRGTHLATASGDGTVKVWDFSKTACSATFSSHTQSVWGVSFHDSGDFLASCSMDHTAKIWDLNSLRCRHTLRGHTDSVNSVCFQPYTNNLVTCSGDKTLSVWDARTGLLNLTLYGHTNSCTHATFNRRGDTIASCDADGIVRLWDIRMGEEFALANFGPHPANQVAFDPSGKFLAVASNDGSVSLFDVEGRAKVNTLKEHEDAVQAVCFDNRGEFLVSAGSDACFRVWCK